MRTNIAGIGTYQGNLHKKGHMIRT